MRTEVHTIDGLATVSQAMALMHRHQVASLVVPRRDEDDEMGVVLVSDIAREVIARNRAPERVNVYEIMSKPVLTLASEMQARYAVRLLVALRVYHARWSWTTTATRSGSRPCRIWCWVTSRGEAPQQGVGPTASRGVSRLFRESFVPRPRRSCPSKNLGFIIRSECSR